MSQEQSSTTLNNSATAIEAVKRGYQPVPLVTGGKRSTLSGWTKLRWDATPTGLELVKQKFDEWAESGQGGIGVLLGEPSGGLIDIDLDHPKTRRLKDNFLPPTAMRSGRTRRPGTHYWYIAKPGTLQDTRTFRLPNEREAADERMIVEYRSTGGQTALPGNLHPEGDEYLWYGEPWGGDEGPTEVDGRTLAVQVALLALCTLLVQYWPGQGARHEAYLALAGGLLRVGEGVHPYWERNAPVIIDAIAEATNDEDADTRVAEVMGTTIKRLKTGKSVAGFGKLAEIIGEAEVRQARVILAEIESLAGVPSRTSGSLSVEATRASIAEREAERVAAIERAQGAAQAPSTAAEDLVIATRNPLEERIGTWEALDLDPYLTGQVEPVIPTEMMRVDGSALMYPGRLNMLYGPSESAKSWIAMHACMQVIERGGRVVYIDLEDEPVNALQRMQLLGAGYDDIRNAFSYVRPEEPLEPMMRSRWGEDRSDEKAKLNNEIFQKLLESKDPELIVADGLSVLYGLHGLDTNDTTQTDIITTWLKTLSRNGRTTVIVVDHTAKNPARGSLPIGSQHKTAMVQGTLLQAYPVSQPMPGAVGEVELIVLKDRIGKVREIAHKSGEKAQLAARVIIDSQTTPGRTELTLRVPSGSSDGLQKQGHRDASQIEIDLRQARAAERAEKIERENADVLNLFQGDLEIELSKREMQEQLFGSSLGTPKEQRNLDKVVLRLLQSGWLHPIGDNRGRTYALTAAEIGPEVQTILDNADTEDENKIDVKPE